MGSGGARSITCVNARSASARRPRCRCSRPTVRAVSKAPMSTGFSGQALRSTTSTMSEPKVFTLYWRPLKKILLLLIATVVSCGRSTSPAGPPLFTAIAAESSGVAFGNMLPEDSAVNIVNYLYFYNGGGVAAGDIDGDGRIDLYFTSNLGANHLYRNLGHFRFEDITAKAGVADSVGWKTGVTMADVNGDGKIDIYVSGVDYLSEHGRNVLYINNGDGTFTDRTKEYGLEHAGYSTQALFLDYDRHGDGTFTQSIAKATGHTSRFSMGVDAADFNNDGRTDIISLDMMPASEEILKTSATTESYSLYNMRLEAGYHPQYARNNLQLNRGKAKFSEIGYLAGVYATDWSWAALFGDLDNDGRKDLFVTNGVYRRPNDLDYITYVGQEAVQASLKDTITAANLKLLQKMPQVPLPNYAFRNNGNLTFSSVAEAWGLAQPGF